MKWITPAEGHPGKDEHVLFCTLAPVPPDEPLYTIGYWDTDNSWNVVGAGRTHEDWQPLYWARIEPPTTAFKEWDDGWATDDNSSSYEFNRTCMHSEDLD
jgi:hypothetical protein